MKSILNAAVYAAIGSCIGPVAAILCTDSPKMLEEIVKGISSVGTNIFSNISTEQIKQFGQGRKYNHDLKRCVASSFQSALEMQAKILSENLSAYRATLVDLATYFKDAQKDDALLDELFEIDYKKYFIWVEDSEPNYNPTWNFIDSIFSRCKLEWVWNSEDFEELIKAVRPTLPGLIRFQLECLLRDEKFEPAWKSLQKSFMEDAESFMNDVDKTLKSIDKKVDGLSIQNSEQDTFFFQLDNRFFVTKKNKIHEEPQRFFFRASRSHWTAIFKGWDYHEGETFNALLTKLSETDPYANDLWPTLAFEGMSGTGKSVLLCRLAFELFKQGKERNCIWWVEGDCDQENWNRNIALLKKAAINNVKVYVFIDDADLIPRKMIETMYKQIENIIIIVAGKNLKRINIIEGREYYVDVGAVFSKEMMLHHAGSLLGEQFEHKKAELLNKIEDIATAKPVHLFYLMNNLGTMGRTNAYQAFRETVLKDVQIISKEYPGFAAGLITTSILMTEDLLVHNGENRTFLSFNLFSAICNHLGNKELDYKKYFYGNGKTKLNSFIDYYLHIDELRTALDNKGNLAAIPIIKFQKNMADCMKVIWEGAKDGTLAHESLIEHSDFDSLKECIFEVLMDQHCAETGIISQVLNLFVLLAIDNIEAKEKLVTHIRQLIREGNGHHSYLCTIVNKTDEGQYWLDMSYNERMDLIYEAVHVSPNNPYFWKPAVDWIVATLPREKSLAEVLRSLYNAGCTSKPVLENLLLCISPTERNQLCHTWINDPSYYNNDILIDIIKYVGRQYKDCLTEILRVSNRPQVVAQCWKALGLYAVPYAKRYLMEEDINPFLVDSALTVLFHFAVQEAFDCFVNSSQNDQKVSFFLLTMQRLKISLSDEQLQEIMKVVICKINNPASRKGYGNILFKFFADNAKEEAIKWAENLITKVELNTESPSLLMHIIDTLGEKSVGFAKNFENVTNDNVRIRLLKLFDQKQKIARMKIIIDQQINIGSKRDILLEYCLKEILILDPGVKEYYLQKVIDANFPDVQIRKICIRYSSYFGKDQTLRNKLFEEKVHPVIALECIKRLLHIESYFVYEKEFQDLMVKILDDRRNWDNHQLVELALDFIDGNNINPLWSIYLNHITFKENAAIVIKKCLFKLERALYPIICHDLHAYNVFLNSLKFIDPMERKKVCLCGLDYWLKSQGESKITPNLLYQCLRRCADTSYAKEVSRVFLLRWSVNEVLSPMEKACALMIPVDTQFQFQQAKEILQDARQQNSVVALCAMLTFRNDPEAIREQCRDIVINWQNFIKVVDQNEKFGLLIKAMSNPCIRSIASSIAINMIEFAKKPGNDYFQKTRVYLEAKKIANGSFPRWGSYFEDTERWNAGCVIGEDIPLDRLKPSARHLLSKPNPAKVKAEREFYEKYHHHSKLVIINSEYEIQKGYISCVAASELNAKTIRVVFCDRFDEIVDTNQTKEYREKCEARIINWLDQDKVEKYDLLKEDDNYQVKTANFNPENQSRSLWLKLLVNFSIGKKLIVEGVVTAVLDAEDMALVELAPGIVGRLNMNDLCKVQRLFLSERILPGEVITCVVKNIDTTKRQVELSCLPLLQKAMREYYKVGKVLECTMIDKVTEGIVIEINPMISGILEYGGKTPYKYGRSIMAIIRYIQGRSIYLNEFQVK